MTTWTVNLKIEADSGYSAIEIETLIKEALSTYVLETVGFVYVTKSRKQVTR